MSIIDRSVSDLTGEGGESLATGRRPGRKRRGTTDQDGLWATPWSWLVGATKAVVEADTPEELDRVMLSALVRLVPTAAAVVVAEATDVQLRVVASAGDVSQALLAALQAFTGAPTAIGPGHATGPGPLAAAALHHRGRLVGALAVAGPLSPEVEAAVEALATVAGPKLGRLRAATRSEAILTHASEVFTVCRTDGTVVYQSPSSVRVLGAPPERSVGRNLMELVPRDEVGHALAALRMPVGRRSPVIESRWRDDDGRVHISETTAVNLVADSAVGGILLATQDVTERKSLEVELVHAQKLEAVGRLAAGIAHEINTPVQFIGDNLGFLRDAFETLLAAASPGGAGPAAVEAGGDDAPGVVDLSFLREEVPRAVTQALDGVDRVAGIVRAMKALGHPDGGQLRDVDLNRTLSDAVTIAHNELKYVADVRFDLGDVPPVRCLVGDVGQVFLNLLVNSADAIRDVVDGSGTKGRVTLRTRQAGDSFVLTVEDTGSGIAPEVAKDVFEPFFTTKDLGRGTGQGLALARAIVERHGGTIGFVSTPGHGTTFTVTLPVAGPAGAAEGGGEPDGIGALR